MKNKYAHRSKISEAKTRQIVRLFAIDLDASQIAMVTNLNRNTINRYLAAFGKESPAIVRPNPLSAAKLKWMRATSALAESRGKRPWCSRQNHCFWSVQT